MTDIRQSPQFASFMKNLGWRAEKIDSQFVYLRRLPLIGWFAKCTRPETLSFISLKKFCKTHKLFRFKISPLTTAHVLKAKNVKRRLLDQGFKTDQSPFNPTTTIQIDLTQDEEALFNSFSQAKRRAVRRAIKNKIKICHSSDIDAFIKIRQKQYWPTGFLVTEEMKKLWQNFYPQNASLLLAFKTVQTPQSPQMQAVASICGEKAVAGILLLFYKKTAYYWFASSLKIGKKIFAPTLLVWEALKLAKKRGCKIFDFEGVYDERFPKAAQSWKGFTKFKEGFGGRTIVYLENFTK